MLEFDTSNPTYGAGGGWTDGPMMGAGAGGDSNTLVEKHLVLKIL